MSESKIITELNCDPKNLSRVESNRIVFFMIYFVHQWTAHKSKQGETGRFLTDLNFLNTFYTRFHGCRAGLKIREKEEVQTISTEQFRTKLILILKLKF